MDDDTIRLDDGRVVPARNALVVFWGEGDDEPTAAVDLRTPADVLLLGWCCLGVAVLTRAMALGKNPSACVVAMASLLAGVVDAVIQPGTILSAAAIEELRRLMDANPALSAQARYVLQAMLPPLDPGPVID